MHTFQIPRRQWCDRLDEFSRAHEGWPVALDLLGESIGAQKVFSLLSLAGVAAEPNEDGKIAITAAVPSGGFVTHTIDAPVNVSIEQTDEGADLALEIEAADGTKAILRFRVAPPVNGLARGRGCS